MWIALSIEWSFFKLPQKGIKNKGTKDIDLVRDKKLQ